MSSYLTIEFDKTSPIISVFAPRYTTNDVFNTITIESNEKLAEYQDVVIVDSEGNEHGVTFERANDKQYIGNIKFYNLPLGLTRINARMKDDVDNYSNTAYAIIDIKTSIDTIIVRASHLKSFDAKVYEQKSASSIVIVTTKGMEVISSSESASSIVIVTTTKGMEVISSSENIQEGFK
jgi:hypothetical protein